MPKIKRIFGWRATITYNNISKKVFDKYDYNRHISTNKTLLMPNFQLIFTKVDFFQVIM
jgi:hypothetical protein